jgi:hypothetical protein
VSDGQALCGFSQLKPELFGDLGQAEMLRVIDVDSWQALEREHTSLKHTTLAAGIPKALQPQNLLARRQTKAFLLDRTCNVNGMPHWSKLHFPRVLAKQQPLRIGSRRARPPLPSL